VAIYRFAGGGCLAITNRLCAAHLELVMIRAVRDILWLHRSIKSYRLGAYVVAWRPKIDYAVSMLRVRL